MPVAHVEGALEEYDGVFLFPPSLRQFGLEARDARPGRPTLRRVLQKRGSFVPVCRPIVFRDGEQQSSLAEAPPSPFLAFDAPDFLHQLTRTRFFKRLQG